MEIGTPNENVTPTTEKTTAKLGDFEFPLMEVDPVKLAPTASSLIQALMIILAYADQPKINEALTEYGFRITDVNGKVLFPRSTTNTLSVV